MKSSGSGEKEHNSAKVAEKEPLSPCPLCGEQLGGSRSGAAPPAKGLSACAPLCPALPCPGEVAGGPRAGHARRKGGRSQATGAEMGTSGSGRDGGSPRGAGAAAGVPAVGHLARPGHPRSLPPEPQHCMGRPCLQGAVSRWTRDALPVLLPLLRSGCRTTLEPGGPQPLTPLMQSEGFPRPSTGR